MLLQTRRKADNVSHVAKSLLENNLLAFEVKDFEPVVLIHENQRLLEGANRANLALVAVHKEAAAALETDEFERVFHFVEDDRDFLLANLPKENHIAYVAVFFQVAEGLGSDALEIVFFVYRPDLQLVC